MKSFGTFAIKSTVKCSSMCNCKFENMFNSWKQASTLEIKRRLLKKGVESWKQASSLENRRSFLKTGRLLRTQTAREACALYLWYCKQANHLRHVLSAHCFFLSDASFVMHHSRQLNPILSFPLQRFLFDAQVDVMKPITAWCICVLTSFAMQTSHVVNCGCLVKTNQLHGELAAAILIFVALHE